MAIFNQTVSGGSVSPLQYTFSVNSTGELGGDKTSTQTIDFTGVTLASQYICYCMYRDNTVLTSVNTGDLRKIEDHGCEKMFMGCTGILSANLSSVTILGGSSGNAMADMFRDCSNLVSADLSSLVRAAAGSSAYTPLSLTFQNCRMLTNIRLDSLKELGKNGMSATFKYCYALSDVKFPAFTASTFGGVDALKNIFGGISGITVHFPNNIRSAVEALTGYSTTAPFGSASGTVLFDLPSTAHLIGVNTTEYERNPKYDTSSSLAWRVKDTNTQQLSGIDFTSFYTSGITDPAVNDTIYSDSACTVAVTTISSIA